MLEKRIEMKRIITIILCIVILGCGLYGADYVLKDRSEHGVRQCMGIYSQPKDSIDVVFLGSSHVHYGVNTAKLWSDFGISAYDMSSAEQPIWISYYYLKELCKTQHPKVVVIDLFCVAAFDDEYKFKYKYLSDSFNGFKLNRNKINMLRVSMDGDRELWDKYVPAFFGYHDRYDMLTEEDKADLTYDFSAFKGFTPYFENYPMEPPHLNEEDTLPPTDKSIEYLDKIIDFTRENDIQLLFTIVPYKVNREHVEGRVQHEDLVYNWLDGYFEEKRQQGNEHVYFDYTMKHYYDMAIDFESGIDFTDGNSHLNYYGSVKVSWYLANQLRNLYGTEKLPDHRGDPYYESWDRHVEEITALVEKNGWEVR